MKGLIYKSFKHSMLTSSCAILVVAAGISVPANATPTYNINKVIVAQDQYMGEKGLNPGPIYMPHEVVVSQQPNIWISSNERSGFAGITIFGGDQRVRAMVNIEEPGVVFAEEPEEEEIGHAEEVEEPVENFPPEIRLNPEVCLPVRLPPDTQPPTLTVGKGKNAEEIPVASYDEDRICAPLGAEMHARHPHGIDMDRVRGIAYQVIEHSGLNWNADRTAFEIAETTDDESSMLLAYDINDPDNPVIIDGYLLGHGGHEVAVNENNGKVFQGNHEDSPTATPNIWVDVIEPTADNPYGFIDTGWYNAVQGIEVDESLNQVFGTTHVGEKMFAFDGDCVPLPNAAPSDEKQSGENCILYAVDLREPFMEQIPEADEIFAIADNDVDSGTVLPSVLHMHDLTVDPDNHRAYQTLHSIHHAESTGSPEEAELSEPTGNPNAVEEEVAHHFQGRWLAEVDVDPDSPNFQQVTYIDLSNGQNVLDVPNSEDVEPGTPFEERYIHAHWVAVDPTRGAVLVTGEHTGNLGVVEHSTRQLQQVVAISARIVDGCDEPPEPPEPPAPGNGQGGGNQPPAEEPVEVPEPHLHGVQISPQSGNVYVSDEGEEGCFYESVTILKP